MKYERWYETKIGWIIADLPDEPVSAAEEWAALDGDLKPAGIPLKAEQLGSLSVPPSPTSRAPLIAQALRAPTQPNAIVVTRP